MQKFIIQVKNPTLSYAEKDAECFLLSKDLPDDFIKAFKQQAKDKIVLIEERLDTDLDGVVLDLSKDEHPRKTIDYARKELKNKIIGVITRSRRHETMLVSEAEPDFIIFKVYKDGVENLKELTSWYNDLFLIQSAIIPEVGVDYKDFEVDIVII